MMNVRRAIALCLVTALSTACTKPAPQALGTLEYDRITLPAPAAERIVSIDVHEGEQVTAGQPLLQLDATHTQSELASAEAQARQQREALAELQAGPRSEDIAQARAKLAAAGAEAREARAYYQRLLPLKDRNYVAAADLDRARAAAGNAEGNVRAARSALDELLHGTRPEQLAQAQAAVAAAQAEVDAQRVLLGKLAIVATRAGRIDSLPYKLGDQAPVGAPVAILLAGDAPYARIYVPVQQRAGMHVGDAIRVFVTGREQPYAGTVRMIRSEPDFTPYYALIGDDAARLSYLAEVTLGGDAADLPAGLPVRVESLAKLDRAQLEQTRNALFVVSTFGDGEAPDSARGFERQLLGQRLGLADLRFAVLALGDRQYDHFCGFARRLQGWLQGQGAHTLFDGVEVDNGDAAALHHWQQRLAELDAFVEGGGEVPVEPRNLDDPPHQRKAVGMEAG